MQIRLTRKFAEAIDGIDLSNRVVGDLIDLPTHDAKVLVAEGWASPVEPGRTDGARHHVRAEAADRPARRVRKRHRR